MITENKLTKMAIDYSRFLGTWINTHDETTGIAHLRFFEEGDQLMLEAYGAKRGVSPGNWGSRPVHVYAYKPHLTEAYAFRVDFKMDELDVFMAINENKGLVIVAGFITFKKAEDQSDCFTREFFYKD